MIIAQIALPSSDRPSRAMKELARIVEQNVIEIDGDAETVYSPETYTKHYRSQFSWKLIHLLAIDADVQGMESEYGFPLLAGSADGVALWGEGDAPISISPEPPWQGEAVGMVSVEIPLRENLDSGYADINALPGREDAYGPLWEAAQTILRAHGRTKISAYADHPFGEDLSAPSSQVSLARTRYSDFLVDQGFTLTQTEICSRLALPVDETVLATLLSEALAASSGYRTISWTGATPEEHRRDMVRMMAAFVTDMPSAGIVDAEINYDINRLITADRKNADMGIVSLFTAAQHVETGRLVGYTRLDLLPDSTAVIQEDTVVVKDHRGHRLGLLIKAENLRQLRATAPEYQFVQTWNAGENEHMWSINERLGFTPHSGSGQWQLELPA